MYKLEGRKYKLKWDTVNLCFRAPVYAVRGIEMHKSKERPGKCVHVYKVYVWRRRDGEAQRKYENYYVIY